MLHLKGRLDKLFVITRSVSKIVDNFDISKVEALDLELWTSFPIVKKFWLLVRDESNAHLVLRTGRKCAFRLGRISPSLNVRK